MGRKRAPGARTVAVGNRSSELIHARRQECNPSPRGRAARRINRFSLANACRMRGDQVHGWVKRKPPESGGSPRFRIDLPSDCGKPITMAADKAGSRDERRPGNRRDTMVARFRVRYVYCEIRFGGFNNAVSCQLGLNEGVGEHVRTRFHSQSCGP
jgi:hypothetical protein